jgi:predicted lipid carrier protein YhbT
MVDLAMGKAMPQAMFLKGRLKVKGNLMLGLKVRAHTTGREARKLR